MLVGLAGIGLPAHAEAAEKVTITHQGLTRMAPAAGGGARPPGTGMRAMKSRSGHTLRPGSRTAPARIGNQRLGIGSKDLRRLKARTATPETGPNPDAARKAAIRTHKPARRAVKTIDRQPQSRAGRLVGRKPASEPTPASRVDVRPRNFLMPDPMGSSPGNSGRYGRRLVLLGQWSAATGGTEAPGRHAVAALLNAATPDVSYGTDAEPGPSLTSNGPPGAGHATTIPYDLKISGLQPPADSAGDEIPRWTFTNAWPSKTLGQQAKADGLSVSWDVVEYRAGDAGGALDAYYRWR
jgi:hypothetical protein